VSILYGDEQPRQCSVCHSPEHHEKDCQHPSAQRMMDEEKKQYYQWRYDEGYHERQTQYCTNCNSWNHTRKECPILQPCYHCGSRQHGPFDCKDAPEQSKATHREYERKSDKWDRKHGNSSSQPQERDAHHPSSSSSKGKPGDRRWKQRLRRD